MSLDKDQINSNNKKTKDGNIFSILKNYKGIIILLIFLTLISNGLALIVPKLVSSGIDNYTNNTLNTHKLIVSFGLVVVGIFVFTYLQSIIQTYASERVARDFRTKLSDKISRQTYKFIEDSNPSKLLTNLTSDIDSIKMFVSQAIVQGISSFVIIIGASVLLITINSKLALMVLLIIPLIGGTFFLIFSKVKPLFLKVREVIDWLNKVIDESILGSAIIRVLNIQNIQSKKFEEANSQAQNIGISILKLFAILIPIIGFVANMAILIVLLVGGKYVIGNSMTLGDFAAFMSYITLLIFPILILGFISNIIAQASASYSRIWRVLSATDTKKDGAIKIEIKGRIEFRDVVLRYDEKEVLKNVSFVLNPKSKTAIIGPTAAGKTQILYLLTNLIEPNSGEIFYDDTEIEKLEPEYFHNQVGFVFQDSIIFNMSIRENIAFNNKVTEENMLKAIKTAGLTDFINTLPEGIETIVSERGNSLSGGQKQRIMLARALSINPKVLLLDDFTARVDNKTESVILNNIKINYPNCTLVSVTQKISSIENYEKIIVLMEGEKIAEGTHSWLLKNSSEYVQIYNSQKSTNEYELQS